jgi:hypothetical protein
MNAESPGTLANNFNYNYPQPPQKEQDATITTILSESDSDSSLFWPDKALVWPRVNSPSFTGKSRRSWRRCAPMPD